MTTIVIKSDDLQKEFANMKCSNCGHTLGDHASYPLIGHPDINHVTLVVSQCIKCGFTEDKKDFVCRMFRK